MSGSLLLSTLLIASFLAGFGSCNKCCFCVLHYYDQGIQHLIFVVLPRAWLRAESWLTADLQGAPKQMRGFKGKLHVSVGWCCCKYRHY